MKTLPINLPNPYSIYLEKGLLQSPFIADYCHKLAHRFVIITDSNLIDSFGKYLELNFQQHGLQAKLLQFSAGEKYKTREIKQQLEDELFKMNCGRDTCIIALGGGVVTDMAGFVAATYCRGVPAIYVPTSLLAMVDASIGGKTAVNTPYGKNMIGTFSQPHAVFIDPDTLQSLPAQEWKNGIVEMIKHTLIADAESFTLLQNNERKFVQRDLDFLCDVILTSCAIKKAVVEQDEKDTGIRQLLNFGHTIGHAIETLENYQLNHGEAVAIGIVVESYIAKLCGFLAESDFDAIKAIFSLYHLPMTTTAFQDLVKFKALLTLDKKSLANTARFVLLDKIGVPHREGKHYTVAVANDILDAALNWAAEQFG